MRCFHGVNLVSKTWMVNWMGEDNLSYYRVVLLCSADLGKISSNTYDIEAWIPAQKNYREIVSCSNCIDYQARRLRIRFRDKSNEETKLVYTLNSTLVAVQRTLVAILENYQTTNGVMIPEILQSSDSYF